MCGAGSSAAPGGWQPFWIGVKVVKWCLVYLAATFTVPHVPPGEDGGAYGWRAHEMPELLTSMALHQVNNVQGIPAHT